MELTQTLTQIDEVVQAICKEISNTEKLNQKTCKGCRYYLFLRNAYFHYRMGWPHLLQKELEWISNHLKQLQTYQIDPRDIVGINCSVDK